jgi:hypothetical protein
VTFSLLESLDLKKALADYIEFNLGIVINNRNPTPKDLIILYSNLRLYNWIAQSLTAILERKRQTERERERERERRERRETVSLGVERKRKGGGKGDKEQCPVSNSAMVHVLCPLQQLKGGPVILRWC